MLSKLLFAIGLLFAIEGLLYALAPDFMKRMAEMLQSLPTDRVRQNGIIAAAIGAVIIYASSRLLGTG